ncbi:MAG: hypothetical protein KDC45_13140 [Bacteroidetes bacterium]|nr:hypothetical protein [Bacteroidota bacterium]
MGLFSKSKLKQHDDKVFVTTAWKIKSIVKDASELRSQGHGVIVTCHFEETANLLAGEFKSSGSSTNRLSSPMDFQRFADGYYASQILLGLWPSGGVPAGTTTLDAVSHVLVAEHYPTPLRDKQILEWIKSLGPAELTYYEALDSGMLSVMSGRIKPMLEKLGVKEDEVISHGFVTGAIVSAQKKIADKAVADIPARSAGEWLQANCPDFLKETPPGSF